MKLLSIYIFLLSIYMPCLTIASELRTDMFSIFSQKVPTTFPQKNPWEDGNMAVRIHPSVDFKKGISVVRSTHTVHIGPGKSTRDIPSTTPEFDMLKKMISPQKWNTIWKGWNTHSSAQKIRLYTNNHNNQPISTNIKHSLTYTIISDQNTTKTIKIYPVDPQAYWFLDLQTLEEFSIIKRGVQYDEDMENVPKKNAEVFFPPITLLGSDVDIYDIQVTANYTQTIYQPTSRKLILTHFSPEYQLGDFGALGQNLYTILPYYEVHVPLKKGENTLDITFLSNMNPLQNSDTSKEYSWEEWVQLF